MRFTIAAVAAVCAFAFGADARKAQSVLFSEEIPCEMELQDMFTSFMKQYSKAYSYGEISGRYNQFKANIETIRQHNIQEDQTFTMGINEYADLSVEEFSSKYLGYQRTSRRHMHNVHQEVQAAPASIDWRTEGAVTPVKDQGSCGSCWAFSTTGSVEGAWKLAGNTLTSFSEQELVDCSKNGNEGCNGGLMDNAFAWIETNGICTEAAYPYTSGGGTSGTCKKSSCTAVGKIKSYTDVTANSESALLNAVGTIGPISVAVEADQASWQLYSKGIITANCGKNLDHGVLAVGYGTDSGTDYWLVKNSWGASWGESGYIRIARGKQQPQGLCGIAMEASYPVV